MYPDDAKKQEAKKDNGVEKKAEPAPESMDTAEPAKEQDSKEAQKDDAPQKPDSTIKDGEFASCCLSNDNNIIIY